MRTLVLLLALLPFVAACKKELGELCKDSSECESEECRPVPPGAEVDICAIGPPCPADAVDIGGVCIRACSAGCPEGTFCEPFYDGCLASCERDDQCRNGVCTSGVCGAPPD
ncbi:MAG: hypothetical protein IPK80_00605 [Nannocystis sp.]|nr:hypothetical protein [Nannocystis sp.]